MNDEPLRLALDQNFPTPVIEAVRPYLPADVQLTHLANIDARLSEVSDRDLFIALSQLGFHGLVTNNYRMLNIPEEVAAIVATKAVVVVVERLGHDPIRAVGSLLLELPGLQQRLQSSVSNVFRLRYAQRRPSDAWTYLSATARSRGLDPAQLWAEVRVTGHELARPVLDQP